MKVDEPTICAQHTYLILTEGWDLWWDSGSSQPVSSSARSYPSIKSLHLLIEPRTCPLAMRMAALLPGASSWQHLPGGILGVIASTWIRFVWVWCSERVQKHTARPKLRERQSSKIPSGCSKEKLCSVPEPFLILWKWLLDATAQPIISSSFLARFW